MARDEMRRRASDRIADDRESTVLGIIRDRHPWLGGNPWFHWIEGAWRSRIVEAPGRCRRSWASCSPSRGYGRFRARQELEDAWNAAVGEPLCRQTQLGEVRRGVLNVTVSHPALLEELAAFQKPALLAALRSGAPGTTIHDIRFRVGVRDRCRPRVRGRRRPRPAPAPSGPARPDRGGGRGPEPDADRAAHGRIGASGPGR